jgi:formate hydrogenlyase subunit 4
MATMIHNAVHVLVAFALPPLLLGIINRTKAKFA